MPAALTLPLIALVLAAAIYDLRFRRIPNTLTLSGALLGVTLNTVLFGQEGFAAAWFGFFLALALYIPLYLLRAMGAGDVKLMAAIGSIVGPQNWLGVFLCTALIGAVLGFAVAANKGRLHRTLLNVAVLAGELIHLRRPADQYGDLDVRNSRSMRMPHGLAIAAGSLAFLALKPFVH